MPLQDSDNLIIGRGTDSYKITYQDLKDDLNYVPPPTGTINKPTVLEPSQGAGGGGDRPIVTDTITAVDAGGTVIVETDPISNIVQDTGWNQDQDWQTGLLGVGISNAQNIFDGTDSAAVSSNGVAITWNATSFNLTGDNCTVYCSAPFTVQTNVKTYTSTGALNTNVIETLTFDSPGETIQKVESTAQAGSGRLMMYIEVDGKRLVKPGTPGAPVGDPILEFPTNKGFESFEVDDVVQGTAGNADEVKITDIDDTVPSITVDGGTWNNGDTLTKDITYDTKLTLAGPTDLGNLNVGDTVRMGDAADVPYQPVSDSIVTVTPDSPSAGQTTLTLSDKTDLAYFRPGDVVQSNKEWNQDETWSSYVVGASSGPETNGFDSDPTTETVAGNAILDWNVTLNNVTSFEIRTRRSTFTNPNQKMMKIEGEGLQTTDIPQDKVNEVYTIPVTASTVKNIKIRGASGTLGAGISQVYVNGKLLVDQGVAGEPGNDVKIVSINDSVPSITVDGGSWSGTDGSGDAGWNQDQVWSTGVTSSTGSFYSGRPAGSIFDGDLTTFGNPSSGGGSSLTFTPPSTLTYSNSVEIYTVGDGSHILNGGNSVPHSKDTWTTVATGSGTINNLQVTGDNYPAWCAIKVDGRLLVNSGFNGAPTPGDTEVTCRSPLKAPTNWNVESIDVTNRQINLSHATPDDNAQVWVANDNQAGTDFNVTAARTLIDDPLLTNEVDLRSSDFATTPPDSDTLKEIIWDINGTEYSAGTTNPWKPLSNLPTNSTVTVKVKYKGNTLEDSEFSDPVTFTTGNSIRSLFERLAALEANDITDDATDTALLTLIAGLAARIQALEESN